MEDVIVIGAGACGLIAARELVRKGFSVIVLEGRHRTGGRIHSIQHHEMSRVVEAGAEYIHGSLPVTLSLLNEYQIAVQPVKGFFWQTTTNTKDNEDNFIPDHQQILSKQLKALRQDMPVDKFLELHFPEEEYQLLKKSVRGFVQGYDAADTSLASTFAFREEWLADDDDEQYRIPEGYGKLLDSITSACVNEGCQFHFSAVVKRVTWERNSVRVTTADNQTYEAKKLIITVPLGVLQAPFSEKAGISFEPAIPDIRSAANKLGYGGVIKTVLYFDESFWKGEEVKARTGKDLSKVGFIFSDASIPTWWTQYPDEVPMLTGWIGGPLAVEMSKKSHDEILETALNSLAGIFQQSVNGIKEKLLAHQVYDWVNDPFALGAYSYSVVGGDLHKKKICEPVEETLYFAGEAFHIGKNSGTVEAALSEGFRVSRLITGQ